MTGCCSGDSEERVWHGGLHGGRQHEGRVLDEAHVGHRLSVLASEPGAGELPGPFLCQPWLLRGPRAHQQEQGHQVLTASILKVKYHYRVDP